MKYTVISKTGWQGDYFRTRKTFESKAEAEEYAATIGTPEATQDGYKVEIKAHRNPLSKLMTRSNRGDTVKFADGTLAVWE